MFFTRWCGKLIILGTLADSIRPTMVSSDIDISSMNMDKGLF